MIGIGNQAERKVTDWYLSRLACYLIAQNGDSRKPEIAQAQKYFAIQTRRQEISDQMAADLETNILFILAINDLRQLKYMIKLKFNHLMAATNENGTKRRKTGVIKSLFIVKFRTN